MKLIILIIDSLGFHYENLKKIQKETWNNKNFNNHTTFYYSFNENVDKILCNDTDIIIPGEEGLYNIGKKTLIAFEYILNNFDFDYIYRTNLSSYLNTKLLSKVIEETDPEYFGIIGKYNNISYGSGSGYAISKNLTEKVVQFKEQWNHYYIDDVSIGELLSKHGHSPTLARRFDITHIMNETEIDPSHYHYRIKIEGNRLLELGYHYLVHQKIIEKTNEN